MVEIYKVLIQKYINDRNTALVGRTRGENLLRTFKENDIIFRNLEKDYMKIEIVIPDSIVTMNKSFFLGLFETRVQELGKEKFKHKYSFKANNHILKYIDSEFIDAALLFASQKEILSA